MTVGELRAMLDDIDDDVEVKTALQPTYPMRGRVRNVCIEYGKDDEVSAVWIASSDNLGYDVPDGVWSESSVYSEEEDD